MAKLVIKLNDEVQDHVEIKQGDMKIGRKPGCDVVLDNLAVSGEHANIFTIGEDSFIQDLNSTNGTFINNKRITKHHLRNGDQVMIGKHTLVFLTERAPQVERPTEEFAKTVIINPARSEVPVPAPARVSPAPAHVAPAPPPPPAPASHHHAAGHAAGHGSLVIVSGPNNGKRVELVKEVTSLGKTGKRAATIVRTPEGFRLKSGDGDTATKLNGRSVDTTGTLLKNGDIIDVAGTRLQFYLK
jgi:hypothetical protein